MTERVITSVHIQKLGHHIQEIRERALFNIKSKLEHGFVYDNELARCKEILTKLFEWFTLEPCIHEEEALRLIRRILETGSGTILINHYGAKSTTEEIQKVKSYVDSKLYPLVDELLDLVEKKKFEVPPLESELPLSYRSQDTGPRIVSCESTETPIESFIQCGAIKETQAGNQMKCTRSPSDFSKKEEPMNTSFTLKWQHLIASDKHVLESVEQSLRNPTEPSSFLHSCKFFKDVMLQDFPTEVFLQRPAIVLLFYDYLKTSKSNRLTNIILKCLLKLTKCLIVTVQYYRDPSIYNLKWNTCDPGFETSEPLSPVLMLSTENSYIRNIASPFSSTTHTEDTAFLKSKQLTIPQFAFTSILNVLDCLGIQFGTWAEHCRNSKQNQMTINLCLAVLDRVITLLSICLKSNIWDMNNNPAVHDLQNKYEEVLTKFGEALEHFRLEVVASNFDQIKRVVHLHLLHDCVNMLVRLVPLSKVSVLPRNLKSALANSLLDSPFARLYPDLHETIYQYVKEFGGRFETDSIAKYEEVKTVCHSITAGVKFFRNYKSLPVHVVMNLAKVTLPSLELYKSSNFINMVISLCADKLPIVSLSNEVYAVAEEVVVTLLAHSNVEISEETYRCCHKRIVNVIGTKSNTSKIGAAGSQILFMLRTAVLMEICLHGIPNANKNIKLMANEMIIHILKCQILVSEEIWHRTIEALVPILPLLICHVGDGSALGRTVVNMLDPDTAKTLNIPSFEVLASNLLLLFPKDTLAREEAVSRLCWLMGLQNNAQNLLPRLVSLKDKHLGTVCKLQQIYDVNKLRPIQRFYQPSSLHQVMDLLNAENVEPVIRRSALTQISVMLEDSLLHHTFLSRNGINTVVSVIESALTEDSYKDYVDCVIPAVSVLKTICLYHPSARMELSNSLDVYFYVIRSLFIFCSEDRMKQDCSILLFLLLFDPYILGSPAKGDLSIPYLIKEKLEVPFNCNTHWHTSKNIQPNLTDLLSDKWCLSSIQIHWNSEWFGGFKEILSWSDIQPEIDYTEYSSRLHLSSTDILALKSSCLKHSITQCLNDIQNGTSYDVILNAVRKVQGYMHLYLLTSNKYADEEDICSCPWEKSFSRFLNTPPANEEDIALLMEVIELLVQLIPIYFIKGEHCWLISVLKDASHCFPNLLQVNSIPGIDMKPLHQELLNLITECVRHEQQYLDLCVVTSEEASKPTWSHIIEIIFENLKFNDTQHFYDLAYLDCMLFSLVHLTACVGWTQSKPGFTPKEPVPALVLELCELVGSFHCGKGASAAASVMGLSVTRNILLILNHLLIEMQQFGVKSWEICFIGESVVEQNVLYTSNALWLSRDVLLRAAILQFLAGLAMSPKATVQLVQEVKDVKTGKGLCETALSIFLDQEEASVVRENAAALLTNLSSHTSSSPSGSGLTLSANLIPGATKDCLHRVAGMLALIKEYPFNKEMEAMLLHLYTETLFYHNELEDPSDKASSAFQSSTKTTSGLLNNAVRPPSVNNVVATITTPSLLKSAAFFLQNMLAVADEEFANFLQEDGLLKLFFRALTKPPREICTFKDLSLYCDILQMNMAICSLIAKMVCCSHTCYRTILHARDCLSTMLSLLNPLLYNVNLPQLIYLRNRLFCAIFNLINTLLSNRLGSNLKESDEVLIILTSLLAEAGHEPFFMTLCVAINSNSLDLQQSALSSLTALLRIEEKTTKEKPLGSSSSLSIQNLLDNWKTPRSVSEESEKDKAQSLHILTSKHSTNLESIYFKNLTCNRLDVKNPILQDKKLATNNVKHEEPLMAGAEICKILLRLYDSYNIKNSDKYTKRKAVAISTLTSLLCISSKAKSYALKSGFVQTIINTLKELQIKLSLESLDCLRRNNDKKRIGLIFKDLENLIGLLTNFMLENEDVKCAASMLGLADIVHKMWVWIYADRSVLMDVLKMLCTFTNDCYTGCQSLALTSASAGSGPRKSPTNLSLLNEIISLVSKEMELVSRTHDLTVLELSFQVLHNCCIVADCRHLLVKSNFVQCLSRLHPALTKRQKPWEKVEAISLDMLLTFTGHPEGQVCLAKTTDMLDIIMMLATTAKDLNKRTALLVLRNVAFNPCNRSRLLNSVDFINILQNKLAGGSVEEKYITGLVMWALSANNQKAKLILKCAGLDIKLEEYIRYLNWQGHEKMDPAAIKKMQYVLYILRDGEK